MRDPTYGNLNPNEFIEVNGQIWEKDCLGVVAEIQRRWPNVTIQYLSPEVVDAGLYDAPFQVCERLRDGTLRVIDQVWQLDSRVIKMLEVADAYGPNWQNVLDRFERELKKAERARKAQYNAQMDLAEEITADVLKSPKDTYIVNDEATGKKLKFRTTQPVEVMNAPE
jgi:hypothetical protein